jgi:hypothetical protein
MTANNSTDSRLRVEEDALGNVEVPSDHLWGAQTQRSHLNFPIGVGRYRWARPVIRALGILKKCAAQANGELNNCSQQGKYNHAATLYTERPSTLNGFRPRSHVKVSSNNSSMDLH